ncbi:MAG: glycosyl transferase family 90 [Devosia sp.]
MSLGPPRPQETRIAPSANQRRRFYLAGVDQISAGTFEVSGRFEGFIVLGGMTEAEFYESLKLYPFGRRFIGEERARLTDLLYKAYVHPLAAVHKELGSDKPFVVMPGDNRDPQGIPTYIKSRPAKYAGLAVIQRLGVGRHFKPVEKVDAADLPFKEKEDKVVWRGETTGQFRHGPGALDANSRYYIPAFNARCRDPRFDIGYSGTKQTGQHNTDLAMATIEANIKPKIPMEDQLKCRYLLALEGNDVASGLKWMLYSNSLVLMPRPNYCTWAYERFLRPFVHYVPIKPDLSDLEQVHAWCQSHEDECLKIIDNAREFMEEFRKPGREKRIMEETAQTYIDRVTFVRSVERCEIHPNLF